MRTAITFSESHAGHVENGHFERPERLQAIRELLEKEEILARLNHLPITPATREDVLLVHPLAYYNRLEAATEAGGARLDPDTYATTKSLHVALEALGGVLTVTRAVLDGDADNGFAIIRPPGHHARVDEAMGFCLFANVAIAANWARKHYDVQKILIVDFDVHHGNGTQEIFYEDPDVLYMSTHQWPLYPGTGALEETGAGAGTGATVNIPLPAYTGDEEMLDVFKQILSPRALAFNPDLIIISAGYDAHWMDPIGGMNITVAGFAEIVKEILMWARECTGNKLVAALEGGYNTNALAHSVLATLQLLHNPNADYNDPFGQSPRPNADLSDYMDELMAFFVG